MEIQRTMDKGEWSDRVMYGKFIEAGLYQSRMDTAMTAAQIRLCVDENS
jgi:hypothetical protein